MIPIHGIHLRCRQKTPVITIVTEWYVPETAPVAIFAVFLGDYSLETLPLLGSKEHTLCGRQTSMASVS